MIIVAVELPKVKNDTVTFSWHSNKELPYFKKNNFYIRYDGVSIEGFSLDIFWNAFLSLMISIFELSNEEVIFVFPESIPSFIAQTWMNYNGTNNITIFPLNKKTFINPIEGNHPQTSNDKVGILYGGGKESSCTFSILSEVYGMKNIVLFSYVYPRKEGSISKDDFRREKFLLEPLRKDLNVKIQKIITNINTILTKKSYANNIHLALYTGTILPMLIHHNIFLLTHSHAFDMYWTGYYKGRRKFYYHRSRPEYDDYIAERTSIIFNTKFSIKNLCYSLPETACFKILLQRYPHMLKYLLMCEAVDDGDVKWCNTCRKCITYVLFSLAYGYEQDDIDIDYFFSQGTFVKSVLEAIKDVSTMDGENGNIPYNPVIRYDYFQMLCHTIARIDPEDVKRKTSKKGYRNFKLLQAKLGNVVYPVYEGLIEPAFQKLSPPSPEKIREIVSTHCPIIKEPPEYMYWGDDKVIYDYSLVSNIPNIINDYDMDQVGQKLVEGIKEWDQNR